MPHVCPFSIIVSIAHYFLCIQNEGFYWIFSSCLLIIDKATNLTLEQLLTFSYLSIFTQVGPCVSFCNLLLIGWGCCRDIHFTTELPTIFGRFRISVVESIERWHLMASNTGFFSDKIDKFREGWIVTSSSNALLNFAMQKHCNPVWKFTRSLLEFYTCNLKCCISKYSREVTDIELPSAIWASSPVSFEIPLNYKRDVHIGYQLFILEKVFDVALAGL